MSLKNFVVEFQRQIQFVQMRQQIHRELLDPQILHSHFFLILATILLEKIEIFLHLNEFHCHRQYELKEVYKIIHF